MRFLLALTFAFAALAAGAQQLPVADLSIGMHLIHAEVADSPGSRMQGLMYRESMPTSAGMVFVFEENALHCMWMKNTLLPLSVAFIDEAGAIINIADMQPKSEQTHCAAKPARFALEMNKGWFAQRGIKAGAKLRGLEKLKPR
ncbi:MAG TPA: DUF192 domain-containing protein [Burkholderiales bacterium]|jgi:hypothetical protein|nr:DUF192 domain-containing protein [Burkholderiales bacterium]